MTNIFVLTLIITTLISGILWFLDKFFFSKKKDKDTELQQVINKSILNKFNYKINFFKAISSVFPILLFILIIRSFIYEPFQIPSGSMMPTLLIGDFILVEKFTYGIKDPVFNKTLIKIGNPQRGDVVVFKYPKNRNLDYVKRVIGIPGDKITYNFLTKEIIIQPNYNYYSDYNNTLPIKYSNIELSNFIQTFERNSKGLISSNFSLLPQLEVKNNSIRLEKRKENIVNFSVHNILLVPILQDYPKMYYHQIGQEIATWIVPKGQYFMMGDNRDNSFDSRYWGFVPEDNLVGKVKFIWMSIEKKNHLWPISIRFNHIGRLD